jgi:hypothetical protein
LDDTTGAVRSLTLTQTQTTAATASQVEALRVEIESDVKTGAWANAIMAQIDYKDSGAAHGMAATVCAEMIPPNGSLARGALYALDLEFGCGASSTWGSAGPVARTSRPTPFSSTLRARRARLAPSWARTATA